MQLCLPRVEFRIGLVISGVRTVLSHEDPVRRVFFERANTWSVRIALVTEALCDNIPPLIDPFLCEWLLHRAEVCPEVPDDRKAEVCANIARRLCVPHDQVMVIDTSPKVLEQVADLGMQALHYIGTTGMTPVDNPKIYAIKSFADIYAGFV